MAHRCRRLTATPNPAPTNPAPIPGAKRRATPAGSWKPAPWRDRWIRELVATSGGSVLARVLARLLELAIVLPEMERWAAALKPGEAWCRDDPLPVEGSSFGLVEAARGALGHWLTVRHGRIESYQIIAPTTWNFSPRDQAETPGALEQALVGVEVEDGEDTPVAVQHIVRSFDPCMVCTVH